MVSDQFKALWQRQFTLLLHSRSPELATLIETADKLDVAQGYLEALSSDVEAEREQGLFVAALAIIHGLKVMEHFGLIDGDTPPMPANLPQAKLAVGNLLAALQRRLVQWGRRAVDVEPQGVMGQHDHRPRWKIAVAPANRAFGMVDTTNEQNVRHRHHALS